MLKHQLTLALALFLASAAFADSFRCGNKLVREGADAKQIRKACGEPASVERELRTFEEGAKLNRRCFHGTVAIEHWRYAGRPNVLTLVEGRLERVTSRDPASWRSRWRHGCRT